MTLPDYEKATAADATFANVAPDASSTYVAGELSVLETHGQTCSGSGDGILFDSYSYSDSSNCESDLGYLDRITSSRAP